VVPNGLRYQRQNMHNIWAIISTKSVAGMRQEKKQTQLTIRKLEGKLEGMRVIAQPCLSFAGVAKQSQGVVCLNEEDRR